MADGYTADDPFETELERVVRMWPTDPASRAVDELRAVVQALADDHADRAGLTQRAVPELLPRLLPLAARAIAFDLSSVGGDLERHSTAMREVRRVMRPGADR